MSKNAAVPIALGALAAGTIIATGGTAAPAIAGTGGLFGTMGAGIGSASAAGGGLSLAQGLSLAGTAASTAGILQQGEAQAQAAEAVEAQASQENARAQRVAQDIRRQGRYAQSRTQALAAASGAGASDPTVVGLISDLEAETALRAQWALSGGQERAAGTRNLARSRAAQARTGSRVKAGATLLNNATTFAERYG